MHMRRLILLLLLTGVTLSAQAQYIRHFDPWPVIVNGDTLQSPFLGGFNSPKPSLVDFNGDGLVDLFIGEPKGRLWYFENTGTAFQPIWSPKIERLGGVDIGTWHRLVDIDADGDLDLFSDSKFSGVNFYRHDSGVGALAQFSLVDTSFGNFATGFNNTPDFADIDGDGDLDFFFGATSGALDFYRNIGDSANPLFVFENDYYDSILAFPGGGAKTARPNHGFSCIYFVDLDSDTDIDLFYGDIFNSNIYYFENLGDPFVSDLSWVSETYLSQSTFGFNHATLYDIDNDADPDMVVGSANAANIDNLFLWRNNGTPQVPDLVLETNNLIKTIDVGSYSMPALGDLDGDFDLDLIIGGEDGRLTYYQNVGDRFNPSFEFVTDFFEFIDVGLSSFPVLVDWDNDSDSDLLVGTGSGRIQLWRNDGTATAFSFVLADLQVAGIKVDQWVVPRVVDLNDDGLFDLVVGEWDFNSKANLSLYENNGTYSTPSFSLVHSAMLEIITREFTLPQFTDWNNDGRIDLILAGHGDGHRLYLNSTPTGSFPDSLTLILQADSIAGWDDGAYLSSLFADIDSDNDNDLIIGEENGGLNFYEMPGVCCVGFRGNVDADSFDDVNVNDLTFLINFLFKGGNAPSCWREGNVDGDLDEAINVVDVTMLVSYLFKGLPSLPDCPSVF